MGSLNNGTPMHTHHAHTLAHTYTHYTYIPCIHTPCPCPCTHIHTMHTPCTHTACTRPCTHIHTMYAYTMHTHTMHMPMHTYTHHGGIDHAHVYSHILNQCLLWFAFSCSYFSICRFKTPTWMPLIETIKMQIGQVPKFMDQRLKLQKVPCSFLLFPAAGAWLVTGAHRSSSEFPVHWDMRLGISIQRQRRVIALKMLL